MSKMAKWMTFAYIWICIVLVRQDDSYISHQYRVPCYGRYIPENCNYPNVSLDSIKTLEDLDRCVPSIFPSPYEIRNFAWGAAGTKVTYRRNFEGFSRLAIVQRVLRDVSKSNLHTEILDETVTSPIGIAPLAAQKLYHPQGEIAIARAAAASGSLMVLSCLAQTSLEDVANAAFSMNKNAPLWMQVYTVKNRKEVLAMLSRAEHAGYKAIVSTVDSPGFSERNCASSELLNSIRAPNLFNESFLLSKLDPSLTFVDLSWLVRSTRLPVVVKGITTGIDAIKAVEAGASAIWISNHGGRQLDSASGTIEHLPEVVDALQNTYPEVEVYIDGGVRNGRDVFKAIALGAKMIFVGRPTIWSLTLAGEEGVSKMLNIIRNEFNESMRIAGYSSPDQISEEAKYYPIVNLQDISTCT